MSSELYRSQLARLQRQRADLEKRIGEFRAKEASKRVAAARARDSAQRSNSPSAVSSRLREADRLERDGNTAATEAARLQAKVAAILKDEVSTQAKLVKSDRAEREAAERRRRREDQHATRQAAAERAVFARRLEAAEELATVALIAQRPPKTERLRILMLGASSDGDLRVGREQKRIRAAVDMALHRDLVVIDARPAATTADLLDGITKFRPHVIHFSGHSTADLIEFEDEIDEPHDGVVVTAAAFAHAIAACDEPPMLVVLNACRSARQVPLLVSSVAPFAIGMSDDIEDADAIVYAAQFYAAIANGQSIMAAHRSGRAALELGGLAGADLPTLGCAVGSDPATTVLVKPPQTR